MIGRRLIRRMLGCLWVLAVLSPQAVAQERTEASAERRLPSVRSVSDRRAGTSAATVEPSSCSLANGDYDFCSSCGPCGEGEGDCDSDADCADGFICAADLGSDYGLGSFVDVCIPADVCPVPIGHPDYCALCGPCAAEAGDCDDSDQCASGLTCVADVGDSYGWWATTDVCLQLECPLEPGDPDYCVVCGPCESEQGDCDSDSECGTDLVCVNNVGATYGFTYYTDVCVEVEEGECPVSENSSDYCALCGPCEEGEGDCDSDAECESGLICVDDYSGTLDICRAPIDPDEEDCPLAEGHYDYCGLCGTCEEGEGDCDSDADCDSGLVCMSDVGAYYGWAEDVDVCRKPGETPCPRSPGDYDYCVVCGPCDDGAGDCDDSDECAEGLICVSDVGTEFGWAADVDVCRQECPVSPGDADYCRLCGPCTEGQGGCSSDDECASTDLACVEDAGAYFGFPPDTKVCVGTDSCSQLLGDYSYCSVCGPCEEGEGDCDSDLQCDTGLVCTHEVGPDYGFGWDVDVCLPRAPEECADLLGEDGYCNECGPCGEMEGDCDSDDECEEGFYCISNVGDDYGWDPTIDVCLPRDEDACSDMQGDWDYCRLCGPCDQGEGDCDSNDECRVGLVCSSDVGESYGLDEAADVCEINPECPNLIGDDDFCSICGPCLEGQGDCDSDDECSPGLVCANNVGADYGLAWDTDVCLAPVSGICPLPPGHYDYCLVCGPCSEDQGDCDGDDQCRAGLVCRQDVGALLGFKVDVDVCQVP